MPQRLPVIVAITASIVALLAGIGIYMVITQRHIPVAATGIPNIGGPFNLISDTGRAVTDADLRDKPTVMYFGYTYCPEVCPTTLLDLSHWIESLGSDGDKLNYVFVTVDPERDTSEVMHQYVSSFDSHIRGFTGTPAQIAQIASEYHVYYKKIPQNDGSYLMDHSALLYLMNRQGHFVGTIAYQEDSASAIAKLKRLIANGE